MAERGAILPLAAALLLLGGLSACGEEAAPAGARAPAVAATGAEQLAFPGAQGFGRHASGGRGGALYFVDTLEDGGPGSLRACIEAEEPRVCIFRTGGVIRFRGERPIIGSPYITIAGQTAPGGGILLTHEGGAAGLTPLVVKNTHDVVIRHMRVRPDRIARNRGGNDAFTIENSHRVILDHVSGSWALDENYNGHGRNDDLTVSWSVFAEGLKPHDKCALLSSDPEGPQNVSFLNNLCAHNGDRNPDINFPPGSCVEVVNNVFYDGGTEFAEIWETYGGSPVNLVGNVFLPGPETAPGTPAITRNRIASTGIAAVFAADNRIEPPLGEADLDVAEILSDRPVCPLSHSPVPAARAAGRVLARAGAMPRDDVDARIVAEVVGRAGGRVSEPGTLPAIAGGQPPPDADADGMDDGWERMRGIAAGVYDPWEDVDGDGWSNLEEYLDYRHRTLLAQGQADAVQ